MPGHSSPARGLNWCESHERDIFGFSRHTSRQNTPDVRHGQESRDKTAKDCKDRKPFFTRPPRFEWRCCRPQSGEAAALAFKLLPPPVG